MTSALRRDIQREQRRGSNGTVKSLTEMTGLQVKNDQQEPVAKRTKDRLSSRVSRGIWDWQHRISDFRPLDRRGQVSVILNQQFVSFGILSNLAHLIMKLFLMSYQWLQNGGKGSGLS